MANTVYPWSTIQYSAPIGPTPSGKPLPSKKLKENIVYAPGTSIHGLTQSEVIRQLEAAQNLLGDLGLGGGGGGGGYRPQTAEEAAALRAQAALYSAQAKDVPLARELARRMGLAEIGATQAELAANPRRIFEAIYYQSRVKPTQLAKSLQKKITIPGFAEGGRVKAGSVLSTVGEQGKEYALLPPGSVVAPKPSGEKATVGNALAAILGQMAKGGVVSKEKAREILAHGSVHGEELTEKQRGLFGLIASGKKPTRLRKAQEGINLLGLPPAVQREIAERREEATKATMGAARIATAGTSLFDPLGGTTLGPNRRKFLAGLNLREFTRMSPTQQQAVFSMLSAHRVDPADFEESMKRQFMGFNPMQAGTRARFGGILGR